MTTHNTAHASMLKLACRLAVAATVATMVPAAHGQNNEGMTPTPMQGVGITQSAGNGAGLIESGIEPDGRLALAINKTAVLTTRDKATRVNVGQPDIAEVTMVGPTTMLITAKKPGNTQVIVWNEREQSQAIDVNVNLDIAALREELKKAYPDAPITVEVINGQITLRGRVPNLKVAEQIARLAGAYTKEVMNFLEVGGGQQISLNVQFIEVSRAASNQLGFSSTFSDGTSTFGNVNGPTGSISATGGVSAGNGVTLFGGGTLGGTQFQLFLQALKTNSLARTLAEPTLVSLSGEDANFLAGGEIPIPVPQAGVGGGTTITIEYKKFGVQLKYNAVVLGNGRIRMKIAPEVSQLDYNNTTSIGGEQVPGIRTRSVENTVEMAEGQTLAIAGLLQRDVTSRNSATPLLGDLPIVGAFFRNVQYTRTETELVVLVTPRLASAMNPDQVPALTGDNFRYPNEASLYGLGDVGNDKDPTQPLASRRGPAPRFVGPYGFNEQVAPTPVTLSPVVRATPVAPTEVVQPTTVPTDSK